MLLLATAAGSLPAGEARGPAHWSDAEKEHFLLTADVLERESLPKGVTRSSRVLLSDGETRHWAHVQAVDFFRAQYRTERRTYRNFRDTYRYNIAAYRIDRLLGLGMVPVSVERKVRRDKAALTWWVDDVIMDEAERKSRELIPPDPVSWNRQRYQGWIFNQLIYNTDANLGNHLITSDWKLWLIDFTRAFRPYKRLSEPETLGCIERRLFEALRGLRAEALEEATRDSLTDRERASVLTRRDLLVAHFSERAEAEGAFCGGASGSSGGPAEPRSFG